MWWTDNFCLKILIYIALIIFAPIGLVFFVIIFVIYTLYSWIFCKALCCRKNEFNNFDISASHHTKSGLFINPWDSYKVCWYDSPLLLFWDIHKVPKGKSLTVNNINWEIFNSSKDLNKIKFIWIGQASCLLSINKWIILTDPIFSERSSMSQLFGPKRFTPIPSNLWNELPTIDIILISHDHFDHLDYNTVQRLINEKHVKYWCVPLRIKEWILNNFKNINKQCIVELDWWYSAILSRNKQFVETDNFKIYREDIQNTKHKDIGIEIDIECKEENISNDMNNNNNNNNIMNEDEIKIICTPSQHHCHRGLFDKNYRLWCSFVIITSDNKRIFFGGDTGYRSVPRKETINNKVCDEDKLFVCPAFKQIGDIFGPFDLSMMPIGAYQPRWFMSRVHLNPYDSICIHKDLKSKQSVAIHWGTFSLTEENYDDPPKLLKKLMIENNIDKDEFIVVDPGQITLF